VTDTGRGFDRNEVLEVRWFTEAEIGRMLSDGDIVDGLSLAPLLCSPPARGWAALMRVLHAVHAFAPEPTGGTERHVLGLATGLQARGHEAVVVAGTTDWADPVGRQRG
jgi:hypothetical protein